MTISSIVAQSAPAAATETDFYQVPSNTTSQTLSIFVANRDVAADEWSITLSLGGSATADKSYLYQSIAIAGHDTFLITTPILLNSGDILRVTSTNGTCSFNLFAQEKS